MAQVLTKYDTAKLLEQNIRNDSFLESTFLSWVYSVVFRGQRGTLKQEELRMPANQATEVASAAFAENWAKEVALKDSKDPKQKPSLARAIWRSFGSGIVVAGAWKCMWSTLVLVGAFYFVRSLVQYVTAFRPLNGVSGPPWTPKSVNMYNNNELGDGVGWILATMFFVDSIFVGIALQRMGDACIRTGIKLRAALMTAVYTKTFRTEGVSDQNVVSLVATDCTKLYEGLLHLQNVWTAPIEALAIIALLLSITEGIYGLPALGVVLFILPLQYYLGLRIARIKLETVEVSDARVHRMHEVLLAVKLVKFYVWEKPFAKQVSDIRDEEIRLMSGTAVIKTINLCVVFAVPPLIALVIFATYVYNQGKVDFDSAFAFTVLSLFNTLRFPLVVLPKALRGSSEAIASLKRLQEFLLLPEFEDPKTSKEVEAHFDNAVLSYAKAKDDFKLTLPKLEVKPGEVLAIVGRVGAGKSSIFQAILNNMRLESGNMKVGGKMAYVPQTPWVQNLSLRENITFGLPFDEAKYKRVVHACALELDFTILPKGDATLAGERGINLSGGQRQRVCLARAAYHDCDMVLLDNPLSAVDQHTARHIFDHCIKGMLKDKAVIWITHQLELLPECTSVCIMDFGRSLYFGPYDANSLNKHLPVDHLLFATVEAGESGIKKDDKAGEKKEDGPPMTADKMHTSGRKSFQRSSQAGMKPSDSVSTDLAKLAEQEHEKQEQRKSQEQHKSQERKPLQRLSEELAPLEQTPEEIAALFNGVPHRLSAFMSFRVFFAAGGTLLGIASICLFAFTQTVRIISDTWVRWWAPDRFDWYDKYSEDTANLYYLMGYLALVLFFVFLLLARDSLFSYWHIRGSTNLHNRLFDRVLKAPMLFFLRTPVGDVLNAFAKDQDTLDETLPDTLHMSTIYLMILLTSLGIVASQLPIYVALIGALFAAFFIMQFLYLPAATVVKRWSGETANMCFVHVDESLHGMEVIKAFDAVHYFVQENIRRINVHHLALFNIEQCHLWLAFWCDFFGAIMVLATCLLAVSESNKKKNDPEVASAVGLAISNSIQVLVFFTWVIRGVADSVSMWDAVERIATYVRNVPEETDFASKTCLAALSDGVNPSASQAALNGNGKSVTSADSAMVEVKIADKDGNGGGGDPPAGWPSKGDLKFEKVCLRYYPGAPLALKFVSFHIKDGEKVGVVGRTGSGKTTLLMALFRMFELAFGKIVIDGVNLASINLKDVRSNIAIIPQEPVMFKGTVRSNLDPFGEISDAELWRALRLVHMKKAVQELPGGLDAEVAEGGSNFSLGQKQLVCMARCVLKKTRILVLDEATAAMDLQTDALIQKTIRKAFAERTTITIAHRLDTIIFSDKILAMAAGQQREFDHPTTLLNNPHSMFNALVEDTGPHASKMLRRMAAEGPKDDKDDDEEENDSPPPAAGAAPPKA